MWTNDMIMMLAKETGTTLVITLGSTFMAYVIGLPIGILLVVTAKGGLKENYLVYKILDVIVNVVRSVPFLILLIALIPFTKLIVGKSYGTAATIVPLIIAAAPFVARLVESSLMEVDKGVVEAAQSMGASKFQIVFKVLLTEARISLISGATISLGTILGYSAMAGVVGGGGLGDIAIRYGYNRYNLPVLTVTVILLILLVQALQWIGTRLVKKLDRRIT